MSKKMGFRFADDVQAFLVSKSYISSRRVGSEIRFTCWDKSLFDCENKRIDYTKSHANENRRSSSVWRTKQSIFDYSLVNSVAYAQQCYFLTLTYRDYIKDVTKAKKDLRNFVSRYKQQTGISLAYIGVIEFQDKNRDGVIHFHLLIFNSEYIYKNDDAKNKTRRRSKFSFTWEGLWSHGFVNVKSVNNTGTDAKGKSHTSGVARYLSKYMTKSLMSDTRLRGHQFYIRSRNLYSPSKIYAKITIDNIAGVHRALGGLHGIDGMVEPTYTDQREDVWFMEGRDHKPTTPEIVQSLSARNFNLTTLDDGIEW